MTALPDNFELQKLVSAGLTDVEIAKRFNVTPQAVSFRLVEFGMYRKGKNAPITSAIPWNVAERPDKARVINQSAYRGLRHFLGWRMGDPKPLNERAKKDLRLFLAKVTDGLVLDLAADGFTYVPRTPGDVSPEGGRLVVRWPAGVDLDPAKARLFTLPAKLPPL